MLKRLRGLAPLLTVAATGAIAVPSGGAMAVEGHALPGQIDLPTPATPVMQAIVDFHNFVNPIIILISIFVMALLLYVMWRFSEKKNPKPSATTHNTLLEVAWTVVPIFILVAISIPSFKLLHMQYSYPKADLTIKATGSAWYWTHAYPDQGGFEFDSNMLSDEDTAALRAKGVDAPRLLAVDNPVVVPVDKVVHVLVTASDVIHNWTVQPFGSKIDAVPGRLTSTWFKAEKEGMFYGQCSELCGMNHAFMPIAVRVVKDATFQEWAAAMKAKDRKKAKQILDQVALEEAGAKKVADAAR
ncbi:MAG: cytochrome c oxidase subunit II [Hyphomicrobium sp.]